MSHMIAADVRIEDNELHLVEQAAKDCSLEFREGQKTFRWWNSWVNDYHATDAAYKQGIDVKDYGKCEHALAIPGNDASYEVGICRDKEGKLRFVCDFIDGQLANLIGTHMEKLTQAFSAQKLTASAMETGYTINNTTKLANGDIEVRIGRPSYGKQSGSQPWKSKFGS